MVLPVSLGFSGAVEGMHSVHRDSIGRDSVSMLFLLYNLFLYVT